MDDMKTAMSSSCIAEGCDGEKNNSNLKLICLENGANGLGIKLSKSTWDPYPFVSFVDETREQLHGLQIGDCLLKVVLFVGDSSKDIFNKILQTFKYFLKKKRKWIKGNFSVKNLKF